MARMMSGEAIYGYLNVEDNQAIATDGTGIIWGPLKLNKGQVFTKTIKRMRVTDDAGTYTWRGHLTIAEAGGRCANHGANQCTPI